MKPFVDSVMSLLIALERRPIKEVRGFKAAYTAVSLVAGLQAKSVARGLLWSFVARS